jgi:hypothetical protein
MEETSEEGREPPGTVDPVVVVLLLLLLLLMMMTTTTTSTTTMRVYPHSSYVPSRYGNGLQFFIFTLHGIEPHDTSTIELQISHCTD